MATYITGFTRLRPHWRPAHNADPIGFDRWIAPDGANGWVKILNPDGHLCRQAWSVAPQARLCLRLHPHGIDTAEQLSAFVSDPHGFGVEQADAWHVWLGANGLVEEARAGLVVMEAVNEAPIWEPQVAHAHNIYAGAFGKRMRERGYTAVIGNFNTGWPGNTGPDTPVDWTPLLATLHAIRLYGHILGLHEYCDARGPIPDWGWNMGRFTQLPREFATLPILFTEVGYDRAVNAPEGTGNHGWQGELSIDVIMEYLTEYDRRLRVYLNVLAAFIFTHDWDPPWGTWDTRPLLDRLIAHAEWVREQPPAETHTISLPTITAGPSTPPTAEQPEPQPPAPTDYFGRARAFVRTYEGGYVDHPDDPGGATNMGVTLATFRRWRQMQGMAEPTKDDLRAMHDDEATAIYRAFYWLESGADELGWPLALIHFDSAVLHGPGMANLWLATMNGNTWRYMAMRAASYLSMGHVGTFGRGWANRWHALVVEIDAAA